MSLLNNFVRIFSGGTRNQVVDSQQASRLLRTLDDMLDESWKMLTCIRSRLPAPELESIEVRHNQLYLMVVDVKSDIRGRQGNQVFFASTAERDEFYVQIRQLISRCQIHHEDVITISRRMYEQNPAQQAASSSSAPAPISTEMNRRARWISSRFSKSGSESSSDSQRFIASVAHVPSSALATEEELRSQLPDGESYYRILICGNQRKRVIVVDPKPHLISANCGDEDAEHSQEEILRVGDMLMKSDPDQYVVFLLVYHLRPNILLDWKASR
ncbi:hypothetical protein OPQ81_003831 [Rhizoctonia solani]|nr:hypothetical protein OPQ81_003831 [Rhizoctonia solani]